MAYSMSDLEVEVSKKIDEKMTLGVRAPANWIAQEVMSDHPDVQGIDADFHTCCSFQAVRDCVRRVVKRYAPQATVEANRQIVLPGFERLQTHYLIERNDEQEIVPVQLCTDDELLEKAKEYDAMAIGCSLHAAEIRRYIEGRNVKAA